MAKALATFGAAAGGAAVDWWLGQKALDRQEQKVEDVFNPFTQPRFDPNFVGPIDRDRKATPLEVFQNVQENFFDFATSTQNRGLEQFLIDPNDPSKGIDPNIFATDPDAFGNIATGAQELGQLGASQAASLGGGVLQNSINALRKLSGEVDEFLPENIFDERRAAALSDVGAASGARGQNLRQQLAGQSFRPGGGGLEGAMLRQTLAAESERGLRSREVRGVEAGFEGLQAGADQFRAQLKGLLGGQAAALQGQLGLAQIQGALNNAGTQSEIFRNVGTNEQAFLNADPQQIVNFARQQFALSPEGRAMDFQASKLSTDLGFVLNQPILFPSISPAIQQGLDVSNRPRQQDPGAQFQFGIPGVGGVTF